MYNSDHNEYDTDSKPRKRASTTTPPPYEKADVAALTREELIALPRKALMAVLNAAALPMTVTRTSLAAVEISILQKLALQARRCCRNQGY